jgi:V8-like Glu-specific endopeptidase
MDFLKPASIVLSLQALFASDTALINGHVYTANQEQGWAAAIAMVTAGRVSDSTTYPCLS